MLKNREAYICLSAMLRAREPKLLTAEQAEHMIDAPSLEDAAKTLTDLGYEDMSHLTAKEIEHALTLRREAVFAEIDRLCPDKGLADIFRLKYDYHNIKVIIKSEASGTDADGLLSGSGRIEPQELKRLYNEEQYRYMPGKLGAAAEEAKSLLARTSNPQLSDFLLDRAYFAELSSAAETSGNVFLKGYTELLTDITNLKGIIRTLRMGKSPDFLEDVLVSGGKVSVREVLSAGSTEKILALFSRAGLGKLCAAGSDAAEGGRLTQFELACDNAVNSYIKQARHVTYGSEPVAAYLAAVENETTTVRMILTGKLAGIKSEILKERLRDLYA